MNILEELEMLIKLNEDDFNKGSCKYILQQFIDEQKDKLNQINAKENILEYLISEQFKIIQCIIKKACSILDITFEELTDDQKNNLFDIDCDKDPLYLYDKEDMEYHNYNLGSYKTIENIINFIKK